MATKHTALIQQWRAFSVTALLAGLLVGSKDMEKSSSNWQAAFPKPTASTESGKYRDLEKLLGDAAWKAGALRAIAMHGGNAGELRSPAARAEKGADLESPRIPLRLLTAEVQGTPDGMACKLTTEANSRLLSNQPVQNGSYVLGTIVDADHEATLSLDCQSTRFCLFGCKQAARATIGDSTGQLTLSPTSVVLKHTVSSVDAEHASGSDANRAEPRLIAAADAPEHITPVSDRVSYIASDKTDYVRIYPVASQTSALLCAPTPIANSVRVRPDSSEATIGATVFGGRCLAASTNNWNGLVFEVVSTTLGGFDYEIIALSAETSPDLGVVAWFVAQRLANDVKLTRKARTDATRELLQAFDVHLAKERRQVEVVGDRTVVAFVDMLADIAEGKP